MANVGGLPKGPIIATVCAAIYGCYQVEKICWNGKFTDNKKADLLAKCLRWGAELGVIGLSYRLGKYNARTYSLHQTYKAQTYAYYRDGAAWPSASLENELRSRTMRTSSVMATAAFSLPLVFGGFFLGAVMDSAQNEQNRREGREEQIFLGQLGAALGFGAACALGLGAGFLHSRYKYSRSLWSTR